MSKPAHDSVIDQSNLGDRIKEFYELLNDRQWVKCFELIDPRLRDAGAIEFAAFANSLSSFFEKHGPLTFRSVAQLTVYTDAVSRNDERDFAYGLVAVEDRDHHSMQFRERWVKDADGFWYTRKVGLV